MERLGIGQRCEVLWREEWDAALQKEIARQTANQEIEWKKANAVPVKDRRRFVTSFEGQMHKENVIFARQTDQGLSDDEVPAQGVRVIAKRPKGKKSAILAKVALAESEARGLVITERFVKTCWDEYRQLEQ